MFKKTKISIFLESYLTWPQFLIEGEDANIGSSGQAARGGRNRNDAARVDGVGGSKDGVNKANE